MTLEGRNQIPVCALREGLALEAVTVPENDRRLLSKGLACRPGTIFKFCYKSESTIPIPRGLSSQMYYEDWPMLWPPLEEMTQCGTSEDGVIPGEGNLFLG